MPASGYVLPSSSSSLHGGRVGAALLEVSAGHGLPQAQQRGAGLGHIHVDGVELLDRGQRGGLVRGDERARRDAGSADPSGDGGIHPGIGQVDAAGFHVGAGGGHVGLALGQRGGGVVVVLPADGLDRHQFFVAFGFQARALEVGLGLGQCRHVAVVGGLVGSRIDLVERFARFHVAAFAEPAGLDDAVDLGPDIGHQVGNRAPGQFRVERHALRLHGHHADHRRAFRGGRATRRLATGGQQAGGGKRGKKRGESVRNGAHGGFLGEKGREEAQVNN